MMTVILAGGLGTRISEETETKPKPMIKIITSPLNNLIIIIREHFLLNRKFCD